MGIEVWAIGREEHKLRPGALDGIPHTGCLVCWQVVHDYDVPGLKGRQKYLFDIGQEDVAVHRAVVDKRCGHSG